VRRFLDDGLRDPEGFWARAAEAVPWFRKWDRAFEWTFPTFRWFIGAQTNLAYNALDHHVANGRGAHTALIYFNERGERQSFTYAELLDRVTRTAAALRGLGLRKGDRLTIYMPTSPEAIVLMLATVRIGAIHSVVFAGFGARALGERIQASGSRLVFTANVTYRKGKEFDLTSIVNEALGLVAHAVEHVVVLQRGTAPAALSAPRDMTWDAFLERGHGQSGAHEVMESNETAFILATSGTTARPKLATHTHGGYQVHIVKYGSLVLRLEAHGRVVVHLRHRLDRRPQLHGLRAAPGRLHHGRVRGRARSSARRRELENWSSKISASPGSSPRRPPCAC
jgi:acetyl-CoA synthetase